MCIAKHFHLRRSALATLGSPCSAFRTLCLTRMPSHSSRETSISLVDRLPGASEYRRRRSRRACVQVVGDGS
ncbi:hypothetical protein BC629DRAFT_1542483 [Irpex lacteus]|nr:hypothetical protein BC629DRAFT_1542483 [Irpex lacteus]